MADDLQRQIDEARQAQAGRRQASSNRRAASKGVSRAEKQLENDAEQARRHAAQVLQAAKTYSDQVASINTEMRTQSLIASQALKAGSIEAAQHAHDLLAASQARLDALNAQHQKLLDSAPDFGFSDDKMQAGRKNPWLDQAVPLDQFASGQSAQAAAPSTPAAPATTHLAARDLQARLNSMGANLKVDGIIGPKTQAAMAQYGLDVNGNPTGGGGTAGGGGGTSTAPATSGGTPANPPGSDADVRSRYGYMAWALDIPEVGDALRAAAAAGEDQAGLFARISQTNWWKTTSASARTFQQLQATDPASAQQDIDSEKAAISAQASKLGITIAEDRLTSMATDARRLGWNAEQVQSAIGNEFHYKPGGQQGGALTIENQLKQIASDYLQPVSDSTLSRWEQDVISGRTAVADFEGQMKAQAKSLYPSMAASIDAGQTAAQFAEPYRQVAAKTLEMSPDTIDFADPRWNKALNTVDPKTGQRMSMSLSDWDTELRSNPIYNYQNTQGAKVAAYDMAGTMARAFGKAS